MTGAAVNALLRRELLVALRRRAEWVNPLIFYVVVASLFPLALVPDIAVLRTLAPGIIWVAALLAQVLAVEALFRGDYDDGALEQLLLSPAPASLLVAVKLLAHWLAACVPLLLATPLLGLMLGLGGYELLVLLVALLLGTPTIIAIGAIGAALTVGLRRGGALLALLVLPLYAPVLVFGAGAVRAAAEGAPITVQLYLLAAFLLLAVTLAPFAVVLALRISVE